jgi:predicted nucleic acid-binding protein
MTYLVDTDVIADWLKGIQSARTLLPTLQPAGLAVSILPIGEIEEGIVYGYPQTAQAHAAGFRQFLRGVTVLPLTRRIMHRFAQVRGDLRQRGLIIGDFDIAIAATALHYNLSLVTRNTRHFQRVPGLTIY